MTIPRLYHATVLLLSDGSILTTGTDGEWNKPPFNKDLKNFEQKELNELITTYFEKKG
jgi:hypothetical protein